MYERGSVRDRHLPRTLECHAAGSGQVGEIHHPELVRLHNHAGTLGNWVTKYREEHPASQDLSLPERARLRELEKENRELRLEAAFLNYAEVRVMPMFA